MYVHASFIQVHGHLCFINKLKGFFRCKVHLCCCHHNFAWCYAQSCSHLQSCFHWPVGFFYQFKFDTLQELIARIIRTVPVHYFARWCGLHAHVFVFSDFFFTRNFSAYYIPDKIQFSPHRSFLLHACAFSVSTWNGLALYTCQINVYLFSFHSK